MPIHDWSKASAGVFHDFHGSWIYELRNALNKGVLPAGYFATAERRAAAVIPDILTFEHSSPPATDAPVDSGGTLVAVAEAPPAAAHVALATQFAYHLRQRSLVIRLAEDSRVVAILEVVSRGNKSHSHSFESLVQKAVSAIEQGIHFLVIDLQRPGRFDPHGIHAAIWSELESEEWQPPSDKPLTVSSYAATAVPQAWVYPLAVGDQLPSAPLMLTQDAYVPVPLEQTYCEAFLGLARPYQQLVQPCSS